MNVLNNTLYTLNKTKAQSLPYKVYKINFDYLAHKIAKSKSPKIIKKKIEIKIESCKKKIQILLKIN